MSPGLHLKLASKSKRAVLAAVKRALPAASPAWHVVDHDECARGFVSAVARSEALGELARDRRVTPSAFGFVLQILCEAYQDKVERSEQRFLPPAYVRLRGLADSGEKALATAVKRLRHPGHPALADLAAPDLAVMLETEVLRWRSMAESIANRLGIRRGRRGRKPLPERGIEDELELILGDVLQGPELRRQSAALTRDFIGADSDAATVGRRRSARRSASRRARRK